MTQNRFNASAMLGRLPEQFFAKLVARTNEQRRQGHDVINLGQGNPDRPTPPHIVQALQREADNAKFHKYSPFTGHTFLKEAVAKRYWDDYRVLLDPETEVAVLFGSKTGLVEISQILLNPGDVVLMPDPGYPDYWSGAAMADAVMEPMPLRAENDWLPDYSAIPEAVLNRAKLMFVNYPNNPTAATASLSFHEETVRVAERHGICVASDFAYGAIGYDGRRPVSFLEAEGAKEVGVEFYTLSKTYNMAGWRIGFAVGHAEIIAMINLLQDHLYCSLFGGLQAAAAEALTAPQDCVDSLVRMYERRRDTWFAALRRIGWDARPSEGTFFAWLPVPNGWTSVGLAEKLLEDAKVVVAPGAGFGSYGEGYVRIALLEEEARLEEAAERIGRLQLFG